LSAKSFIVLKEEKQWLHPEHYELLLLLYPAINGNNLLTLLAADPLSSRPEWFSFTSRHVFPISAWFQLALFPGVKWARPLTPLCLLTVPGSSRFRQLLFFFGYICRGDPFSPI
jgi:hypothetical protein